MGHTARVNCRGCLYSTPAKSWPYQLNCISLWVLYISKTHPFLGASPDSTVYDPSTPDEPFGFLEIKCPYTHRNITPMEASLTSRFCSSPQVSMSGSTQLCLLEHHPYFAQVQGQMAVGGRPWSDFVLFTTRGISIQRIPFNKNYWEKSLLPKLIAFYDNCLGPEIVSPVHVIGLPIRNLARNR